MAKETSVQLIQEKSLSKTIFRNYQLYLLILPALIFTLVFNYLPMYGVTMAFREYDYSKGLFFSPWIGFHYFERFFSYYKFNLIMINTIIISSLKHFVTYPLPIVFAIMIVNTRDGLFKKIVQSTSYLPNFVSWVVVVALIQQLFGIEGIINDLRLLFGAKDRIFFLNDPDMFYPMIYFSNLWKGIGMASIIYIAALSGVDPSLYEAAEIDGANKLKQIWHVSLPSIAPTIIMLFIMSLGSMLSAGWEQVYLLMTPGNSLRAEILDTYVINVGLLGGEFNYASAVGLFSSLVGLGLILITNKISKKVAEISLF